MRKLILSMALAIFSVGAYAQVQDKAITGTNPTKVINCSVDDAQNPIIGKKYTYTVEGQEGKYHFFATNQTTFIQGKTLNITGAYKDNDQIKVGTGNYNQENSTSKSIDITWTNSADQVSYLVVNHLPNTGCTTTNNLKVLKIQPKNAFFIELRNIDGVTTKEISNSSNVNVCLGAIKSAEIQGNEVTYDYGEQSLFYELVAVNYDKTFIPKIKVQGLQDGQTATLKWGYSRNSIDKDLQVTINHNTSDDEITIPMITALETIIPSQGVSIYLELVIHNGKVGGTTRQDITLLADATTGKNNQINNVKTNCAEEDAFADKAIQTLQTRPEITSQNGLIFIPAQP